MIRARSVNNRTASPSGSGANGKITSPDTSSGSRLVASTVSPGQRSTSTRATRADSSIRCSQLSSTSRAEAPARHAAIASRAGAGDGVRGLPAGSRVVGCSLGLGGYASHRVLPAHAVVPLPQAVSFEVAASAVESYATMLFALTRRASLRPGEWVLVLGAGGGIGLAAVDVATALGARVIAAASSPAKRAAAVTAGAQATVDYHAKDLTARVRQITGTGADLVVDPVGDPFAEPALRSLRAYGRYLVIGFAGGSIPRLPLHRILLDNRSLIGVDWGAWSRQDPAGNQALVADLLERIAAGALHPSPRRPTRSSAPPRRSAN